MESGSPGVRRGRRRVAATAVICLLAAAVLLIAAGLAAAAPLQAAKTINPAKVGAWLTPKHPTQHSTISATVRVWDSSGQPYSGIPVRFVWRVDGKRLTVTKKCDATGRATSRYRLGAVKVGHRDHVTVTPYGADWSKTRHLWFVVRAG